MNIDKLNGLLERKNGDISDMRDELVELVNKYPYSGPFHMLLAKASKDAGHLDQKKDLLAAAAHSTSRKALFELMFGESFRKQARVIHEAIEVADDVSEEELVELVWHSSEDENEDEMPIEREAAVEAISALLDDDVEDWENEENPENGPKNDFEEIIEKKLSKNFSTKKGSVKSIEILPKFDDKKLDFKTRGDANSLFGKWLESRAKDISFGDIGYVETQVERGAASIIDAFIKKGETSIGALRNVEKSVENWAEKGVLEDPSLVTETMAKLYAKQGQMRRARKAFKMLALKYPEKSVYFAAQLKKLSGN